MQWLDEDERGNERGKRKDPNEYALDNEGCNSQAVKGFEHSDEVGVFESNALNFTKCFLTCIVRIGCAL